MRELILARVNPKEVPDPTPIHIPGMQKPLSIREEMQRFIREEISRQAVQEVQAGSFEEEDDFEEEDEAQDLLTGYSVIELHPQANDYALLPEAEGENGSEDAPESPETAPGAVEATEQDTTPPADLKQPSSLKREAKG